MNLYDDAGWLDMPKIMQRPYTFNIICHGRGTGKTYGALKYLLSNNILHIYLRRTGAQIDTIKNRREFNPYFPIDSNICFGSGGTNGGFCPVYHGVEEDDKLKPSGAPIGYLAALSKVADMRGFSGTQIEWLFYDEFIRKKQEKRFPGEDGALFDLYESIARNKELSGAQPLKCLMAANSDNLANDIFIRLGLVTIAEKMKRRGIEVYEDGKRSLALYIPGNSPISEKKKDTALYKLLGAEDDYTQMATGNEFVNEDLDSIKSLSLKPYNLDCICGEISVYKHKSDGSFYVSEHASGTAPVYNTSDMDLKRFAVERYYLWLAYLRRRVTFEGYIQKLLFERYFNIL